MNYSALIGNPVGHSVSNYLFQYFAQKLGIEYSHIKIPIKDKSKLNQSFKSLENLGFRGFNVTLPYKTDSIKHLDFIDSAVSASGAVNTIVIEHGRYKGFNTDTTGAIETIKNQLKPIQKNDGIILFGAGGAARAVLHEVRKYTKNIVIANRTINKGIELSKQFNIKNKTYKLYDSNLIQQIIDGNYDYFINCTSLGMTPDSNSTPMNLKCFKALAEKNYSFKNKFFLDAVFNPFETKFLQYAKMYGGNIASGMYWMIYQGIEAFNLWNQTSIKFDQNSIQEICLILKNKIKQC